MIYTSEVIMTFKDDKVNEFTMNMDMKLNDDDMITMWDSFVTTMNSTFEPVEEDGIKISTAVDEDNHAFRVTYEVSLDEASEETIEEYDLSDMINSDETLEEIKSVWKKKATHVNNTCVCSLDIVFLIKIWYIINRGDMF